MLTKFKRDNHFRAQLFHPGSFKHQGKANLNFLLALLQHLPAGQTVIDPMAGTGSALIYLDYCLPVVCGELEPHWAQMCEINRKFFLRGRLFAASTPSLCSQWDAARLPLQNESVAAIVTSPPYWDMFSDWHISSNNLQADGHEIYGVCYGLHPGNIGNIHIYEDYLRSMAIVYRECNRVLRTGGIMALIIKNRIHKQRLIPICQDTITLASALGFHLVSHIDRNVTPSFHRHILQQKYPMGPRVDTETILIFRKRETPGDHHHQAITFIQGPKLDSLPSWQLFRKQLRYCQRTNKTPYVLTSTGIKIKFSGLDLNGLLTGPSHRSYRQRKEYAFHILDDFVINYGFAAGDEIEFHGSMSYGQYVTHRAVTLGMSVVNPTEGLNMGQKLKWYTEKCQ